MKTKLIAILRFLLALALLGGIAWGVYFVVAKVFRSLTNIKSDISVAIVAASATITVSIVSLVISKVMETRATIIQELRAKKVPIYEELISTMFKFQFAEKLGEERMSEAELIRFFANLTEKLTIWGSDGIIRAFSDSRLASSRIANPEDILFIYENLLLEIRKDLGHKNKNLKRGTILSLFINDIEQYLRR
jgi:hypothetical protein